MLHVVWDLHGSPYAPRKFEGLRIVDSNNVITIIRATKVRIVLIMAIKRVTITVALVFMKPAP